MHRFADFRIIAKNVQKFIVHMQRMRASKADALDALYLAKPHEQVAEVDFFVRARKALAVIIDVLAERKMI